MTIRFENLPQFKLALSRVAAINTGAESLSANCCVLIQQHDPLTTSLTTVEPGRGCFTRFINHETANSGGTGGVQYLVPIEELNDRLRNLIAARASSITLKASAKGIDLKADYAVVEGKAREKGTRTVRAYHGETSDFGPVVVGTTLLGSLEPLAFNTFVELITKYGEFSSERAGDGDAYTRRVLLEFLPDRITGLTSHKQARQTYLKVTQPGSFEQPLRLAVEGRHLGKLKDLSKQEPVRVLYLKDERAGRGYDEDWVTFRGDQGCITLAVAAEDHQLEQYDKLFDPEFPMEHECTRVLGIQELINAVQLVLPKATDGYQFLLMAEDGPQLQLLQANNVQRSEYALVPTELEYKEGEWHDCLLTAPALALGLGCCQRYIQLLQAESSYVTVVIKSMRKPKGTSRAYMMYIQPVLQPDIGQVTLMICTTEPTKDRVDVDE